MQCEFKIPYKQKKLMRKLYGKHLAREIAFGRKLVKTLTKIYKEPNEICNADRRTFRD